MKYPRTRVLAALALGLPCLLAFQPTAERIAFAPSEGSTVTKVFTNTMNFGLDDMSMLMNGEENPMMPEIEMDMQVVQTITVSDTYDKMGSGRPALLTRSFDEIGSDFELDMTIDVMGTTEEQSPTGSGTSPLEGRSVIFEWNEEEEDFEARWPEEFEGEDTEMLENLVEDMDLRGLLPEGDLAEGESYDIALINLVDLLAPGGDLKVEVDMEGLGGGAGGPDPELLTNMRELLGDMLEGSAQGTLREVRGSGDERVAVIALEINIDAAKDMSEFLSDMMSEEMPEGMEFSLDRVDVEFALETTGEMLWHIGAGHVQSLSLEGDSAAAMDMEMGMDFGGQSMTMEMSMEMSGTMEITVETE